MTNITIHQGNQIGGCITVISTDTTKVVIDFGESLPGAKVEEQIAFDWAKEKVDAVFFTHYHGDHIGRFMEIPKDVSLYMGEVTWKILRNINDAIKNHEVVDYIDHRPNVHFINPNEPITVGDMVITPYSVDHSAFDAYMFLVETPDKNILHTGDYRDHGHRGHKIKNGKDMNVMLEVIRCYVKQFGKRKIDVLITEGTMMGDRKNDRRYSEKQMLQDAKKLFKEHKHVFLKISSTNADSLASFYHAAAENGMALYASGYVLSQLDTFAEASRDYTDFYQFENKWPILPKPTENSPSSYLISFNGERKHMREDGFLCIVSEYGYYEELMADFEDLHPIMIYSLWKGYIDQSIGGKSFNPELAEFCKRHNARDMHTSGHAYPEMIEAVINAVDPEELIPIHTENRDGFATLQIPERLKAGVE